MHAVHAAALVHIILFSFNTVLLFLLFKEPKSRLNRFFLIFMTVTLFYSFFSLMRALSQTESTIVFWANMRMAAMSITPFVLLRFCMMQTIHKAPTVRVSALMISVAVLNVLLAFTNDYHHLFRESVQILQLSENSYAMKVENGIWFYSVYLFSLYVPVLFCLYFYAYAFAFSGERGRIQYSIQFFALLLLAVAGFPLVVRLTLYDTYGMSLLVFIVINYLLLTRYGFLDIVPMAKQTAFDVIDSAVVVFGPSGKLVDMNLAARGYSSFMPFENMYSLYGFFTDTDCMSPVHGHQVTKRLNLNGEEKYFSAVFHKIADLGDFDRSCIAGITDVTEHHRLAMMKGERERLEQKKVIIGDIHDGISGNVTVISMLAGQEFENEADMREALRSIGQISADAAQDIRLMMGAYDRESVTLSQLSGDMRHIGGSYTTGRNISFSHNAELGGGDDALVDFSIYVNLVHFFKECVVNTVKHSGADTVQSFLSLTDGRLVIEYSDNGVGLKEKKNGGYGLSTMRKRVDNIGGELTLADENGLRIRAVIPFQR
jgi:signal transduction histidine kinase